MTYWDKKIVGGCYGCVAPENMFTPNYEDVTPENKALIAEYGMPCEGGGAIGEWCRRCHWHRELDIDECEEW